MAKICFYIQRLLLICVVLMVAACEALYDDIYQKAKAGDAEAQAKLSDLYYLGEEVPKDYKKAFEWAKKAAEQGNAKGQNALGYAYDVGEGIKQDRKKAAYWYKKSALQGNAYAQNALGLLYEYGDGVEQNLDKAFFWYQKAVRQKDIKAYASLGTLYDNKAFSQHNYKKAEKWLLKAAKQKDAYAVGYLSNIYFEGRGKKLTCLRPSEDMFDDILDDEPSFLLTTLCEGANEENYIAPNRKKAIHWLGIAAQNGDADAQSYLGNIYILGRFGIEKDYALAEKWLLKAVAQREDKEAFNELGTIYSRKDKEFYNCKKAIEYFNKAIMLQEYNAAYNMALRYENGECVPKDLDMALNLYQKALKWVKRDIEDNVERRRFIFDTEHKIAFIQKQKTEADIDEADFIYNEIFGIKHYRKAPVQKEIPSQPIKTKKTIYKPIEGLPEIAVIDFVEGE